MTNPGRSGLTQLALFATFVTHRVSVQPFHFRDGLASDFTQERPSHLSFYAQDTLILIARLCGPWSRQHNHKYHPRPTHSVSERAPERVLSAELGAWTCAVSSFAPTYSRPEPEAGSSKLVSVAPIGTFDSLSFFLFLLFMKKPMNFTKRGFNGSRVGYVAAFCDEQAFLAEQTETDSQQTREETRRRHQEKKTRKHHAKENRGKTPPKRQQTKEDKRNAIRTKTPKNANKREQRQETPPELRHRNAIKNQTRSKTRNATRGRTETETT